jgi:hypothetical protein
MRIAIAFSFLGGLIAQAGDRRSMAVDFQE